MTRIGYINLQDLRFIDSLARIGYINLRNLRFIDVRDECQVCQLLTFVEGQDIRWIGYKVSIGYHL